MTRQAGTAARGPGFAGWFFPARSEKVFPYRCRTESVLFCKSLKMARPIRFERTTFAFGGQHSIQLSYGRLAYYCS